MLQWHLSLVVTFLSPFELIQVCQLWLLRFKAVFLQPLIRHCTSGSCNRFVSTYYRFLPRQTDSQDQSSFPTCFGYLLSSGAIRCTYNIFPPPHPTKEEESLNRLDPCRSVTFYIERTSEFLTISSLTDMWATKMTRWYHRRLLS